MFSECVSEAVVELCVDLGRLEAKGCSEWFELERGLFICWDWSAVSWARSSGVERKSECVSGDGVVAINEGLIDSHARHGAAACR